MRSKLRLKQMAALSRSLQRTKTAKQTTPLKLVRLHPLVAKFSLLLATLTKVVPASFVPQSTQARLTHSMFQTAW